MNTIQKLNQNHYDQSWKGYDLLPYTFWPHWKSIKKYINSGKILELGPGNRPRIPVIGNTFVEISDTSLKALALAGGETVKSDLTKKLPLKDGSFAGVVAFEILEHLPNPAFVLKELHRILKNDGCCVISFPLNMELWTDYDVAIGHVQRFNPDDVQELFDAAGFQIQHFAAIAIPWPTPLQATFECWMLKHMPALFHKVAKIVDRLPGSAVLRPIILEKWDDSTSAAKLHDYSTGLFVLRKKRSSAKK